MHQKFIATVPMTFTSFAGSWDTARSLYCSLTSLKYLTLKPDTIDNTLIGFIAECCECIIRVSWKQAGEDYNKTNLEYSSDLCHQRFLRITKYEIEISFKGSPSSSQATFLDRCRQTFYWVSQLWLPADSRDQGRVAQITQHRQAGYFDTHVILWCSYSRVGST